ncbi:MAG: UDP-N-acetylmuramoyl-L-alanine--D-glutamate ligase [Gammaproteobacteria bacterium]|nr:UDP-N-acetylmuramoyl-L-alanine--D-glutamate ligase [Gammaproteobacteria bacterium]
MKVIVGLGITGLSCARFLAKRGVDFAVIDTRENPRYLSVFKQEFPNIPLYLGGWYPEVLARVDEIIVSPGLDLKNTPIEKQIKQGKSVIGDIELFARFCQAPVVGITGSNGKSTVTTLLGEMAKASGLNVAVGGNLGIPVLDLLQQNGDAELFVLELSSFQLELTRSLKLKAAVLLNVSPDHMDRYLNFNEYLSAKLRIYDDCEITVINGDENLLDIGLIFGDKELCFFSSNKPSDGEFGLVGDVIYFGEQELIKASELKIQGRHQLNNLLAALSLGKAINLPMNAMLDVAKKFAGLPHRCQFVRNYHDVAWYNDSKGTNVGATLAAIDGLSGPIILIAGGQAKGADFSIWRESVKEKVKTVILIGEDGPAIDRAICDVTNIIYADSMAEAVRVAARVAEFGDKVLLSPGCASFDMFRDFVDRGEQFTRLVRALC